MFTGVFALLPPKLTTLPSAALICLTDFWESLPDWSLTSFLIMKSLDLILLVYPVKGTKGCVYSPDIKDAACLVFANTPIITGCCASSPSIKKPNTLSPGKILIGLPLLPRPEPLSGDKRTCAQGSCSFVNSRSSSGWYPKILTFTLFPQPFPLNCEPCASSGATCPTHQRKPSLPKKLLLIKLFSIMFLALRMYLLLI